MWSVRGGSKVIKGYGKVPVEGRTLEILRKKNSRKFQKCPIRTTMVLFVMEMQSFLHVFFPALLEIHIVDSHLPDDRDERIGAIIALRVACWCSRSDEYDLSPLSVREKWSFPVQKDIRIMRIRVGRNNIRFHSIVFRTEI